MRCAARGTRVWFDEALRPTTTHMQPFKTFEDLPQTISISRARLHRAIISLSSTSADFSSGGTFTPLMQSLSDSLLGWSTAVRLSHQNLSFWACDILQH